MGSSAENFDTWFKERLGNYEEPPREAAWEHIADKLGHTRKKRVMVFILRIAAGMALTLSLGLGYYYYIQHRSISVAPSLAGNQQSHDPSRADAAKMAAGSENKGISSGGQDETISVLTNGLADPSGAVASPADPDHANTAFISGRADLPSGIHALPALVTDSTGLPGLAVRQGNARSHTLSETDLIMAANLAMMNALEDGQRRHNTWIMGGQMAPLYSYRNLSSDYTGDQDLSALNSSEKGVMAYAGGVALAYKPSKRLSVESGIYYSKYGQEKTDIKALAINRNTGSDVYETNNPDGSEPYIQVTISNSTGIISNQEPGGTKFFDSDNSIAHGGEINANVLNIPAEGTPVNVPDDLSVFQYFEYLEIPLIVKYKIVDRKLDFNLLGGISTNFLAGNSVKVADNGKKYDYGETNDITKVNYSGSVGIGFEYPVMANLMFNLEPKFRYYLNPIDKSVNMNVYPYSFGLFAGISYVF